VPNIYFYACGDVAFSNNSAVSSGGAFYASKGYLGPTFINVTFSDNTAKSGGAVFFSAVGTYESGSSDEEVTYDYASQFIGCRFERNLALLTGGAMHSEAGFDLVENTTFKGNSVDEGGALRISGTVGLINSSFLDNMSGEGGGSAISNRGVFSEMVEIRFSGNGIYCPPDSFVDVNEVRR